MLSSSTSLVLEEVEVIQEVVVEEDHHMELQDPLMGVVEGEGPHIMEVVVEE